MADADYCIDDILRVLAKGASRADFAAHAEAAEAFRELSQVVGPELASLYARDWRLEQRTVRMQVDAHVSKSDAGGILRIFVKGAQTSTTGHTLEVEDRYVAGAAAPLDLDQAAPPRPEAGPVSPAPPVFSDQLRDEVEDLLLNRVATTEERDRARDKGLAVGDRFHTEWRLLLRRALLRLGWPGDGPPSTPSADVRDFLRRHAES
jgi:hypothetical protein